MQSNMARAERLKSTGAVDTLAAFQTGRAEAITLIRRGMPALQAKAFLAELSLPPRLIMLALGLSPASINRKAAARRALTPAHTERVFGVARLVGQIETMVEESGCPDGFDARHWISLWLLACVSALGGQRPLDLLDTMEGQRLVSEILALAQTGAYA